MEVTIPYEPRKGFLPFHASKARWNVLVCHRRMGKTVACTNHLIRDCLRNPNSVYAYVGPNFPQVERIAWRYFREFTRGVPGMKFNESKLSASFPNGSTCYLLGAERPDSIRGVGLWGCVLDEYQLLPPDLFGEVVSPCLADHSGYAVFCGTIRGKNQLWRLHDEHQGDPDWFTMYVRASESGIIPAEELAVQRSVMGEEQYAQEFELDPLAVIRGAVFGKEIKWLRDAGRVCPFEPDPYAPVDTYWDLGIGDYTAVTFIQSVGLESRVIDFYQTNGESLELVARTLRDKGYRYGTNYLPHDAKQRSLETGRTREEFLQTVLQGGISVVERPRKKEDAIQAFKLRHKELWVNSKLDGLLDCMEQYSYGWDEKRQVYLPTPKHDQWSHGADSLMLWAQARTREAVANAVADSVRGVYNINENEEDDVRI